MGQKKNDYLIPLAIIGMMFFIVGFALGINSYIVPLLQGGFVPFGTEPEVGT